MLCLNCSIRPSYSKPVLLGFNVLVYVFIMIAFIFSACLNFSPSDVFFSKHQPPKISKQFSNFSILRDSERALYSANIPNLSGVRTDLHIPAHQHTHPASPSPPTGPASHPTPHPRPTRPATPTCPTWPSTPSPTGPTRHATKPTWAHPACHPASQSQASHKNPPARPPSTIVGSKPPLSSSPHVWSSGASWFAGRTC